MVSLATSVSLQLTHKSHFYPIHFHFSTSPALVISNTHCSNPVKTSETLFLMPVPTKNTLRKLIWQLSINSTMAHNQHATLKKNSQFSCISPLALQLSCKLSCGSFVVPKRPAVGLPVLYIFPIYWQGNWGQQLRLSVDINPLWRICLTALKDKSFLTQQTLKSEHSCNVLIVFFLTITLHIKLFTNK